MARSNTPCNAHLRCRQPRDGPRRTAVGTASATGPVPSRTASGAATRHELGKRTQQVALPPPDRDRVCHHGIVIEIRDDPQANRFEAWVDGALAGFAEYRPRDGWLIFVHTEVDPAYAGKGVGARLAAGALDAARERGLWVTPLCPYIAAFIDAHPAYRDLVVGVRGPHPGQTSDPSRTRADVAHRRSLDDPDEASS
jgi:predicted GNAT family acetyltransferase